MDATRIVVSSSLAVFTIAVLALAMSSLASAWFDPHVLGLALRRYRSAFSRIRAFGRVCSVLLIVLPRISPQETPRHSVEMAAQVVSETVDSTLANLQDGSDAIGSEAAKEESSRKDGNESPSLELPLGLLASELRYSSQSFRSISVSSALSYVALTPKGERSEPRERAPPTTHS